MPAIFFAAKTSVGWTRSTYVTMIITFTSSFILIPFVLSNFPCVWIWMQKGFLEGIAALARDPKVPIV